MPTKYSLSEVQAYFSIHSPFLPMPTKYSLSEVQAHFSSQFGELVATPKSSSEHGTGIFSQPRSCKMEAVFWQRRAQPTHSDIEVSYLNGNRELGFLDKYQNENQTAFPLVSLKINPVHRFTTQFLKLNTYSLHVYDSQCSFLSKHN
jgi:hypothetical protein